MLRRRLIVGTSIAVLYALSIIVARLVYGPGDTLSPEQLSAVVLKLDDVPGAQPGHGCSEDSIQAQSALVPENVAWTVFIFDEAERKNARVACVLSMAALAESRANAARVIREHAQSFAGQIRLTEDVTGTVLDVKRLDTQGIGERSFSYSWRCRECEDPLGVAYIIQFQRANVMSVIVVSAIQDGVSADQAMVYARKQDQRIIAALNAND